MMNNSINRRSLLKIGTAAPLGMMFTPSARAVAGDIEMPAAKSSNNTKAGSLKGFIIADAHFGWRHPAQPNNMALSFALCNILTRFPDLDVFIDSGDVHHRNADDQGRAEWTEIIGGGTARLPLFLAAGNHEIIAVNEHSEPDADLEARTMLLGSISCRPYYSFDLKGVHFVCLPPLQMVNLITEESLAWLELDLSVNRDKTALVISHNALHNTTSKGDSMVYRQIANSARVQEVLNGHPQVVAWMHGHNHTWELVRKDNRFYVSNGRFGGFSPSDSDLEKGTKGHIGGVYFEIDAGSLTVRGYSASANCFFDQVGGYGHLSQTMSLRTSFDPDAPACVSWGMGGARNGLRMPVYLHHTLSPTGVNEVFVSGTKDAVFSENSDFSALAEQTQGWSRARSMAGLWVQPKEDVDGQIDGIQFNENAVVLLPLDSRKSRSILSPCPGVRASYYRCAPGHRYRARIVAYAQHEGPIGCPVFYVYDSQGTLRAQQEGRSIRLETTPTLIEAVFHVPESTATATLYQDETVDMMLGLALEARFDNLTSPVVVQRLELSEDSSEVGTRDVVLEMDGQKIVFDGTVQENLPRKTIIEKPLNGRFVVGAAAQGSRRFSWLVRQSGLLWQVRNAAVSVRKDGALAVGPLRNRFSDKHEILFVPFYRPEGPYVHSLRGINLCAIEPYDAAKKEFRIHIEQFIGSYQEVQIYNAPSEPREITNVRNRAYQAVVRHCIGLEPKEPGLIAVRF